MSAVELSYTRHGRPGPPVLVLGGSLGTTEAMWEPQLAALGEDFDLIAFDHRGHGASPVAPGPYTIADLGLDVVALLDRLGLERVAYCGLSIGGMVGQWLAVNAPERIEALVLICTAARVPTPEGYLDRAAAVREAGTPEGVADAVIARWFTAPFAAAHPELVGPSPGDDRRYAGRGLRRLLVAGARFELLESAAHLASVERPEAVTALIHDHLGGRP